MTEDIIRDALDKLRGAVMIVYPMQLPPYDPIRLEFEGNEDLSGTQVMHHPPPTTHPKSYHAVLEGEKKHKPRKCV